MSPGDEPARGRAKIFYEGSRVFTSVGRNNDGSWSKRTHITAIFLDPTEALAYASTKRAAGIPVEVAPSWSGENL